MTDNTSTTVKSPVNVLVVDDQPGLAQTLALAISRLGSHITASSATSAKQALELAASDAVDILITDMVMPDMTGLELAEKLHNHPGGGPSNTILMTAYEVPGLRETARRLNIKEIIIKPFHPERINQLVAKALDTMPSCAEPEKDKGNQVYKILIADDIEDNITLLSRYMQNEGFHYITASNGVEALQKTRTEMPDLVLLDVNMPEKDGFTVLKEIRDDPVTQHLPVIIFTAARPHPSDIHSGLVLGADDYITKPFDRRELFARIRTKLRLKDARDSLLRRNRELSILPEIGKELSTKLNRDEISNIVLKRSVEALGASTGHIIILNFKNPFHKEYHIPKIESCVSENWLPLFNNLIEEITEQPKCVIIDNTQNDPRWQISADNTGESIMIVPILGRDKLIGIMIFAHERPGYFKEEHIVLTQAIASQAGIALENCHLYSELSKEQERVSAVLSNAADAILMFDADECLSMLNPTAKALFSGQQVQPGLPLAHGCGYEPIIESLKKTFESGAPHSAELVWHDKRVFTALVTPLAEGGCVLLLHDVSHFKQLEKVKDEFIATASHDLRNPLTSIKGYSNLILQAGGLNDLQVDFIRRIQHASEKMTELVENMLDLAKMDLNAENKFEVVDIAPLLIQIVDEFKWQADAKSLVITFENVEGRFKVQGDALKLHQALHNLVGNAIKYTPNNGTVMISVETKSDTMSIHIKDTGYGIPSSDIPNIFKRFYRVRNNGHDDIEGNGLGLAIVKSIIEQHGGQISVESEPNSGSCFTITLPLMNKKSVKRTGSETNS